MFLNKLISICFLLFLISCSSSNEEEAILYKVGDTGPGTGIVFYEDEEFGFLLEAAPSDLTGTYAWSDVVNQEITYRAQGYAIGTGQANTFSIINQENHTSSAAKACRDLNTGEKSDWFLPSYDELIEMYEQRDIIKGFENVVYWTSSEFTATTSSGYDFQNNVGGDSLKSDTLKVRCIRLFYN